MAYQFDSDTERICIDTGASACLSTRRDNFISLRDLDNIKINGIASGLKVAGIGVLRWSIRDDNNTEIDLYIKDALYVPDAPMGLLCPQQIAQQTKLKGDGFLALDDCGILTFSSYKRTIKYDCKIHSIEGVASYLTTIQEESQTRPIDADVRTSTIQEESQTRPLDADARTSNIPEAGENTAPLDATVRPSNTPEGDYTAPRDAAVFPFPYM
jgi:hypothetical protein